MARIRVGIIVDKRHLARWQAEAIRRIAGTCDLLVYNCANSRPGRRFARNALYYLLNLFTIRNPLTRPMAFPADIPVLAKTDFECVYEGNWQVLPDTLLERVAEDRVAVLIKFGMGLLRVPDARRLRAPILSYHHGDPRRYRGRPAGFYEMMDDADCMGQVVQLLSNDVDAGAIAAYAETRIHPHSYRQTLVEAYRASPLLLGKAIDNALSGRTVVMTKGRNYRLPSNTKVMAFCAKLARSLAARLAYGAFVEKRWQVALADVSEAEPVGVLNAFPGIGNWTTERVPSGYRFIADPFFHPADDGVLVEGMSKSSGAGEILHVSGETIRRLAGPAGHCSYPATISFAGEHFLIPEIAETEPVRLFRLHGDRLEQVTGFAVEGNPSLIDPTPLVHEGRFYLFGNRLEEGPGVLRLWTSERLAGRFAEHPRSPVRISPLGSRMAGSTFERAGSLWRVGQDSTREYGDGVLLFEIERLSAREYKETERARLRFDDVHGPHTVNFSGSRVLFDFYRNEVSVLAGFRRLRSRIRPSSRRQPRMAAPH